MSDPYKALYIHIPFCKSKCLYCDFRSDAVARGDERIDAYIEELVMKVFKMGRAGELSEIETIYIGGGTPSYVGSKSLTSLMYALGLSVNLTDDIEVTVEANPESFDERLAKDLYAMGVNRISLGVQSFDDDILRSIGRAHDAETAIAAINAANTRFENISIDLMCGLPGQDMQTFADSTRKAIELDIPHISIYPLTVEDGTRLSDLADEGSIDLPNVDAIADMMEAAWAMLTDAGYEHYEVSNFAKPGFRSRHNMSYWQGRPYIGLGDGAVGMRQDKRGRKRTKDGEVCDELDSHQAACEDVMLAMRTSDGISVNRIEELDSAGFPGLKSTFDELAQQGLIDRISGRYTPTPKGMMLGNVIYERILDFF